MNSRQKLDGSDSFVIVFHLHGSPENIGFLLENIDVRGVLLDEVVLFFSFSFKIDIVERRSWLGRDSEEIFCQ